MLTRYFFWQNYDFCFESDNKKAGKYAGLF
jgi:hypothetical protein